MDNNFDSLPWLQAPWSQLTCYLKYNRIPQALIISGKKGLGKKILAEHFVQSLVCINRKPNQLSCGDCRGCHLFKANTHPDYLTLEPEAAGKAISISMIRQLLSQLTLKPQFETNRMVVINSADSLNHAAANAFLKYLEEPIERTHIILITDKPAKLPATISSRCQKLCLSPPKPEAVSQWLKQQGLTENTDLLVSLSQATPLLAKQFSEDNSIKLRAECFSDWLKITSSELNFVSVVERWYKLDNIEIEKILFWILGWVTDMIKLIYQIEPTKIYNQDLLADLQILAKRLELPSLFKYYDFLLLNQQRLDKQLNKQLMFEEILIKWLQLQRH